MTEKKINITYVDDAEWASIKENLKTVLKNEGSKFGQYMVELADEGADIMTIWSAIMQVPLRWKRRAGTFDLNVDLSGVSLRDEKAIRNAFNLLTERLKPVFPEILIGQNINSEIAKMQAELKKYKKVLENYYDLRLLETCFDVLKSSLFSVGQHKMDDQSKNAFLNVIMQLYPVQRLRDMCKRKVKPAKQSTQGIWDECIVGIVNELKRIGYSDRQSYIKTGKFLHFIYPEHYTDPDPDKVRQRYYYHTQTTYQNPS